MAKRFTTTMNIVLGSLDVLIAIYLIATMIPQFPIVLAAFDTAEIGPIRFGLIIALLVFEVALGAGSLVRAFYFFKGNRRKATLLNFALMADCALALVVSITVFGPGYTALAMLIAIIVLFVESVLLNKSLFEDLKSEWRSRSEESAKRKAARIERLERAVPPGRFANLNFVILFWVFIFCSMIGLAFETAYTFAVNGEYTDRAGLLFGPFSPIYGFGGVLMTVALNRMKDSNLALVFVTAAAIGGAFEFFTSWFLEFAFGIEAWDYSGSFLSLGGRTNAWFMMMWGILGIVWVRALYPLMLRLIRLIPTHLQISVTTACMILMIVNGIMTLQAVDCWYKREAGLEPTSGLEMFYASAFDDEWMANRFESMTMTPGSSARFPLQGGE